MFRYGSICSGIEAASVAWEPLGATPSWFAEIEKFPSAVLKHHWPDVDNYGDMCNLPFMVSTKLIEAPDVLVGGTPCQAFSIAGLRNSLDDDRGQLTLKYVELLNEIDKQRQPGNECVAVWENVPGVLSTKDNAFGCFIAGLAGETCELIAPGGKWSNAGIVFGPQRTVAWRVLDAQYFGVAQRRRRVFVIASGRKGFDPSKVLFECEGVRRDTAPGGTEATSTVGNTVDSTQERSIVGALDTQCGLEKMTMQSLTNGHIVGTLTARALNALGARDIEEGAVLETHGEVRKLTPVECERLQGFPDNHTQIPYRGKDVDKCPDGPRYKAIGNSKAVPVVSWIGKRLIEELK